jgi:hypothetical protein
MREPVTTTSSTVVLAVVVVAGGDSCARRVPAGSETAALMVNTACIQFFFMCMKSDESHRLCESCAKSINFVALQATQLMQAERPEMQAEQIRHQRARCAVAFLHRVMNVGRCTAGLLLLNSSLRQAHARTPP